MTNVIITGATGMVGSLVLKHCLQSPEIEKVTSIVRRPTGVKHSKLIEIVHANFCDFEPIAEVFDNKQVAYYCVGVYTGAVPRDKFREITVDYTKAFADILKTKSPKAKFCFLSGQGADSTEKSRVMFARDKGIAENYLLQQDFSGVYLFRPGYIYPVTPRTEPNLSYRIMRRIYPLFKIIIPSGVVTSEDLALAMFIVGVKGATKTVFNNNDIRTLIC